MKKKMPDYPSNKRLEKLKKKANKINSELVATIDEVEKLHATVSKKARELSKVLKEIEKEALEPIF